MQSGVIWMGIVAPAVSLVVSAYLVWRAIRDERRFVREERERKRRPGGGAGGPVWLPDPEGWKDDLGGWEPEDVSWEPDDGGWSPGSDGGVGTSGLEFPNPADDEWKPDAESG